MDDLAFELGYADGHWVRIYMDGRVEGIPDGVITINHFRQHMNRLHAQLILLRPDRDNPRPRSGDLIRETEGE